MAKQCRIGITVETELYNTLAERAKREARTMASLAKYLLLKGLETEQNEKTVK